MRKNNYNNIDFRNTKGFLKTVFRGECEMCNQIVTDIEIHHNDKNTENNKIWNLFHLCAKCHKIAALSNLNTRKHMKLVVSRVNEYLRMLVVNERCNSNKNTKEHLFAHPLDKT